VPASSVITSFVDFLISALFLVLLMIWYHYVPSSNFLFLPFFVVLAFAASFGAGLWITALMVEYRDFRFIVPFLVQFGLYASPVGYVTSRVPEQYRLVYSLNPMVGIIDGFRWAVLGSEQVIYRPGLIVSTISIVMLLVTGIWYFRKTERTFADII